MSPLDAHPWLSLVLGVLAVWRLTHLLHVEHGPWGVFGGVRAMAGRLGAGGAFACFYCLSLWVAAPVAAWLGTGWIECALYWLALSAGAVLIEVRLLDVRI